MKEELFRKLMKDFRALYWEPEEVKCDLEIIKEVAKFAVENKVEVAYCYLQNYIGKNKEAMLELVKIDANAVEGINPDLFRSNKFVKMVYRRAKKAPFNSYPDFYWKDEVFFKESFEDGFPKFVRESDFFNKLRNGIIN